MEKKGCLERFFKKFAESGKIFYIGGSDILPEPLEPKRVFWRRSPKGTMKTQEMCS